jgi:hypothetical protein
MGDEQLQWSPDGTRISALVPMIGAPDAARASIVSAGIGSLDKQDEAGSQQGPASADDLLGTVKL